MGLTRGRPGVSQEMLGHREDTPDPLPGGGGGAGATPAELWLPEGTAVQSGGSPVSLFERPGFSCPGRPQGCASEVSEETLEPAQALEHAAGEGSAAGTPHGGEYAVVLSSDREKCWSDAGSPTAGAIRGHPRSALRGAEVHGRLTAVARESPLPGEIVVEEVQRLTKPAALAPYEANQGTPSAGARESPLPWQLVDGEAPAPAGPVVARRSGVAAVPMEPGCAAIA